MCIANTIRECECALKLDHSHAGLKKCNVYSHAYLRPGDLEFLEDDDWDKLGIPGHKKRRLLKAAPEYTS